MHRKKLIVIAVIVAVAVPLSIVLVLSAANYPPVIDSLLAQPDKVFPSGSAQVVCIVSAPDGAVLSYEWEASGGQIDGAGATATWTAPDAQGFYTIKVTVSDGRGREATHAMMIMARDNLQPEINSLVADADWIAPAGSLNLTCDAEDHDGHALRYEWSAGGGHFEGTGPEVTWIAPEQTGIYEIAVVVSDDYGGTATATLAISVMPDQPPVIEALLVRADHKYLRELVAGERYEVGEGKTFHIECIASHPDGARLSYEWECDAGEISYDSEDGSSVKWTAPYVRNPATVTVTVSDPAGNMVRQSVVLGVVSCSRFG